MDDTLRMIAGTNLLAGWIGMAGGVLSGSMIGLFFHRDEWLGGYGSFPRRMLRLGHIAFFGLGFLNLLFALSLGELPAVPAARLASAALIAGAVLMPTCCFLCAWRKPLWILFPLPVICVGVGAGAVLWGYL